MLSECFKTISECFLNAFKLMAFGIQDLKKDLQNTPHSSQHAQCFGKILKRENRKENRVKKRTCTDWSCSCRSLQGTFSNRAILGLRQTQSPRQRPGVLLAKMAQIATRIGNAASSFICHFDNPVVARTSNGPQFGVAENLNQSGRGKV